MILGKSLFSLRLSFLTQLVGISILGWLGAVKLEKCVEKQLIHSDSGTKIQCPLQETWAVWLGTGHRVEHGEGGGWDGQNGCFFSRPSTL